MRLWAQITMPKFLSLEIIAIQTGRSERGHHAFSIRHRRGGAIGIVGMSLLLFGVSGSCLPEQFSIAPVETHDSAAAFALDGLGDEHPIAPNNRRRIASVGKGRAPSHILRIAPLSWKIVFG